MITIEILIVIIIPIATLIILININKKINKILEINECCIDKQNKVEIPTAIINNNNDLNNQINNFNQNN